MQDNGQGGVVDANGCTCDNEDKLVRGKLEIIGEAFLPIPLNLQESHVNGFATSNFAPFV